MKNAMQLKAVIKNIAKDKHILAQLVMQNFMLERLLERISVSKYQQNFILKRRFPYCSDGRHRYPCYYGYGCNN